MYKALGAARIYRPVLSPWLARCFLVWVCWGLRKHTLGVRRTLAPFSLCNGLDLTYTWAGLTTLSCVLFSVSLFSRPCPKRGSILKSVLSLAVREGRVHSVTLRSIVAVFSSAYTHTASPCSTDRFDRRTTPANTAAGTASVVQHVARMYRGQRVVSGGIHNTRLLPEQAPQHLLRRCLRPGLGNPTGHWGLEEDMGIYGLYSGRMCT